MQHSKALITPAEALRLVFIPPATHPLSFRLNKPPFFQQRRHQTQQFYTAFRHVPLENSTVSDAYALKSFFGPRTPHDRRTQHDGPIRDEAIPSKNVYIVGADNKLSAPTYLPDLLSSLDRKKNFVQQVSPPTEETPLPVCKILDKGAAKEAERARAKKRRGAMTATKTLEIAWGIDRHDLEHRLRKMAELVAEGKRVEVCIGGARRKGWKGKKVVGEDGGWDIVKAIREAIKGLDGGKEWKNMEGTMGEVVTLFVEGKGKTGRKARVEEDGDGEGVFNAAEVGEKA